MKHLFQFFRSIFTFPNKKLLTKNSNFHDKDFLLLKNDTIKSLSDLILFELKSFHNKLYDVVEKQNSFQNKNFNFNITNYFSKKTLDEIERKLNSKNILENISNHFEYNVKFSHFLIRFNYFNPISVEEYNSKMWHRDNDSLFNQLKLFLVLNDLSDEIGGHFYFIPQKKLPDYKKISSSYNSSEDFTANDMSSRIKNVDVNNKYNFGNDIIKYGDDKDYALILDTNDTYHKGGFIRRKGGYRILLQAIYEAKYLSLSNYSKYSNNFFYKYLKIILLGIKNRLRTNVKL